MKYIFKTTATMKEYNNRKWWIDSSIIKEIRVSVDNLKEAVEKYAESVNADGLVSISKNAIRTKTGMFVDTKSGEAVQVGYVITGKADFECGHYQWVQQYVDLWVEILTVSIPDFIGEEVTA